MPGWENGAVWPAVRTSHSCSDHVGAQRLLSWWRLILSHFPRDAGSGSVCFPTMSLSTTLRCATVFYASPLILLLSPRFPCPLFQMDCHLHHPCSARGVHLLLEAVIGVISVASAFLRALLLDSPTMNPALHPLPFLLLLGCPFLVQVTYFYLHSTTDSLASHSASLSSSQQVGSGLLSAPSVAQHCSLWGQQSSGFLTRIS